VLGLTAKEGMRAGAAAYWADANEPWRRQSGLGYGSMGAKMGYMRRKSWAYNCFSQS